jgi:hypothetical protein
MAVVTTLAVVAAGAVAAAAVTKAAADKAAKAQKKAIGQQEQLLRRKLDPEALNRLAVQFDTERAKNRLELQKDIDPQIADLREYSKDQLLKLIKQPSESRQSAQVANQLFRENITPDARMEKLKESIIQRAQEDFDAGASLPPEFQAELVRSGLTTGAQAGIGTGERAIGGTTARLLGGAGLALKSQRAQEGAALASTADALARSRQALLANIFPSVAAKEAQDLQRAGIGLSLSEQLLPEAGLSGVQATDIEIARSKGRANLLAQRGQVAAGQAQAQGQFVSSLIGAGTGLATGGVGAVGGAAAAPVGSVGGYGGVIGGAGGAQAGFNYGQLQQNVLATPQYNQYGVRY